MKKNQRLVINTHGDKLLDKMVQELIKSTTGAAFAAPEYHNPESTPFLYLQSWDVICLGDSANSDAWSGISGVIKIDAATEMGKLISLLTEKEKEEIKICGYAGQFSGDTVSFSCVIATKDQVREILALPKQVEVNLIITGVDSPQILKMLEAIIPNNTPGPCNSGSIRVTNGTMQSYGGVSFYRGQTGRGGFAYNHEFLSAKTQMGEIVDRVTQPKSTPVTTKSGHVVTKKDDKFFVSGAYVVTREQIEATLKAF